MSNTLPTYKFTIALAGQPNTGKSTVFNSLTGSNQHVGNWPGKTVEQKSGELHHKGIQYKIVDLPGTYSLSANSPEEVIARNYILKSEPDLVVVVVDASQLERSFYMMAEVIALGRPVVLALNMMDVARQKTIEIDLNYLEKEFQCKVVAMSASKRQGIDELIEAIVSPPDNRKVEYNCGVKFNKPLSELFESLHEKIRGIVPKPYTEFWMALKLLEGDKELTRIMKEHVSQSQWQAMEHLLMANESGLLNVAKARYKWISDIVHNSVKQQDTSKVNNKQGWFDKFATNPVLGVLLGVFILLAGFYFAVVLGGWGFSNLLPLVGMFNRMLQSTPLYSTPILFSMITQGLVPGIFMVFGMSSFVFGVLVLIGFLEDIGYLPRMACVADSFMNRIGLHGKSFMPLFMGIGCNIAAVMGSRVIDSNRQRLMTIVLGSLIPCSGLMITIAFITIVFFEHIAPLIVLAITVAIIFQLIITSLLLDRTVLDGKSTGMIMELPPYHKPNWRTVWNYTWTHYKEYLKKGGSLIMCIIIVVWTLSYFPNGNINNSFIAIAGRTLEPFGRLMGMDWKLLTCLFVAFFSKEAAISSMAVIYGLNIADGSILGVMMENISHGRVVSNEVLGHYLSSTISEASALAFIFAMLFSIPCFSTVGVIYTETKSLKWTLGSILYYTSISLLWGILAYNTGLIIFN